MTAMQTGRGGMGNHKHGVSGQPPKSPKLRLKLKLDAEREERKARPSGMVPTLRELLRPTGGKKG